MHEHHYHNDRKAYDVVLILISNPNQGTPGTQATWEKFDLPELKLMNLKPNLEMMEGYHADHCHFWNDYVLKLVTFTGMYRLALLGGFIN